MNRKDAIRAAVEKHDKPIPKTIVRKDKKRSHY